MNENFHRSMEESGLSMYQLSKKTGISYSLINDLVHDKKAINQRSAEQVGKIAAALEKNITDIMDPYCVVEGLAGKVDGVKYEVGFQDGKMFIDVYEEAGCCRIQKRQIYCIPRFRKIYEKAVELSVRDYLEEKKHRIEAEQRVGAILERRRTAGEN